MDTRPLIALESRLMALLDDVLAHDGYGSIRIDVRLLKKGQKEVILDCGKQYRFVVDDPAVAPRGSAPGPSIQAMARPVNPPINRPLAGAGTVVAHQRETSGVS